MTTSAQDELWRLLGVIGPWLWLIKPLLGTVAFGILLWRAPPVCWLERVARFAVFVGLLCIMLAVLNSALGPLGDVLFFGGYVLTLLHRSAVEAARGQVRAKSTADRPAPRLDRWSPLGCVVLGLVAIVLMPAPSLAQSGQHGHGHAQHHDWYRHLMIPETTMPCCSERDCRPTRAWLAEDGRWRALLDGRWVAVPPSAVLQTVAPDGNSHICADQTGRILCFVGGVPKS